MAEFISFEYVKAHATWEPVLASYGVEITNRNGAELKALCPFHDDTKPSFGANTEKNQYHCFGCQAKGNILDFVLAIDVDCDDLRGAAIALADTCGIALSDRQPRSARESTPAAATSKKSRKRTRQKPVEAENGVSGGYDTKEGGNGAVPAGEADTASNPPLTLVLKLDAKHPYVHQRVPNTALVSQFEIGVASRGMMKGRLCVPIHNIDEELVAYAGRWADDDVPANVEKYLLPKKFKKTLELFNLHRAVALGCRNICIVEGYFSAMALHAEGVPTVALMGTSISLEQIALLKEVGVEQVTLLLDDDDAGKQASIKILPVIACAFFVKFGFLRDEDVDAAISQWSLDSLAA